VQKSIERKKRDESAKKRRKMNQKKKKKRERASANQKSERNGRVYELGKETKKHPEDRER
jgi:hypothetical protein